MHREPAPGMSDIIGGGSGHIKKEFIMKQVKMFKDALKNNYIVPAFNFANFEILKGILLKTSSDGTLTLSASDLDLSIEKKIDVNVEEEGSVVVLSKLFSDIIRKLPNEQILIEEKENNTFYRSYRVDNCHRGFCRGGDSDKPQAALVDTRQGGTSDSVPCVFPR